MDSRPKWDLHSGPRVNRAAQPSTCPGSLCPALSLNILDPCWVPVLSPLTWDQGESRAKPAPVKEAILPAPIPAAHMRNQLLPVPGDLSRALVETLVGCGVFHFPSVLQRPKWGRSCHSPGTDPCHLCLEVSPGGTVFYQCNLQAFYSVVRIFCLVNFF